MGTTGGGLWKSDDEGRNWRCVSDGFFEWGSVGAIGVSPSNPDVVYVGMGECDIRGNISPGDGVYKSTDGGKTWKHSGLNDSRFIAKIRVHPTNPDVAYAAVLGHVYGPHPERGVFKTTDGGRSWRKVLFVDDRSGAIDVEFDPANPETLYAATWTAWRTPYTLNSGGEGSKLWKSADGGATWDQLSDNPGMPPPPLGKIGVSPSPADPNRVYAIVEALEGGVFVSDDAGATWKRTNEDRNWRQRAWYYTHIAADPKDKDTCVVLNVANGRSRDGGKTFSTWFSGHSDNHDVWIDPADTKRMIVGNDGGATVTTDGGQTWTEQDFPTAQFYHVSTDNDFPYRILGAQQDNSTVRIPSRTTGRGISARDWTSTAGGESGYVSAKPDDPEIVMGGSYGGYLEMRNHRTGESRNVNAWPENPMGAGAADLVHRFQWTFPIVFSPHRPHLLYATSQYVLVSSDLGGSWRRISPDLTRNDKSKMGPSGGPITGDNTSVEYYGTVFTLAESPLKKGVLWAGSDDGLVHFSPDGGRTWNNVTPKGMPEWGLCSLIEASPHRADAACLAVDNHENDDHAPYIFATEDRGKTWRRLDGGLPRDVFVRAVREDPSVPGLLYCGTENGAFVSVDAGRRWHRLSGGLPKAPVHNLVVKDGDLVAATHGRSFWVLDDLTPLRDLAKAGSQDGPRLWVDPVTLRVRWGSAGTATDGKNPLSGMRIRYWLPKGVEKLTFEVVAPDGTVLTKDEGQSKDAGLGGFARTPSYRSFTPVAGMIFWAGGPVPIPAPPGDYTVRMTADGKVVETKTRWTKDPRIAASDKDLAEQTRFARQIAARIDEANQAVVRIRTHKAALAKLDTAEAKTLSADLSAIEEAIYQVRLKSGQDPLNYPIRLNDKLSGVLSTVLQASHRPTTQSYEVFEKLSRALQSQLDRLAPLEVRAKQMAREG